VTGTGGLGQSSNSAPAAAAPAAPKGAPGSSASPVLTAPGRVGHPESIVEDLRGHLAIMRSEHKSDVAAGAGRST
jgi:hypothetical protein